MEATKPYELVVEFHNPTGKARIAAEWAPPTPLARADQTMPAAVIPEISAGPKPGTKIGDETVLQNQTYRIESKADGTLVLIDKATGASASFSPTFAVVYQPKGNETKMDPKGGHYQDDGPVGNTNYLVPSWNKETDYLVAAHPRTKLHASSLTVRDDKIQWIFPAQSAYILTADVALPQGIGEPIVTLHLKSLTAGQYSIGYVGAPQVSQEQAQWIWQPLIWQDKRFPNRSYLTKEFECPIPFVMVGSDGNSVGVGADPLEMPYRMPTNSDSRFGVLVRNAEGNMQPMLFAPVLGGPESDMTPGKTYNFSLRLFVRKGRWYDSYKYLACNLYSFSDIRENGLCSLNTTIDNMMDYLLTDKYSYWYPQFKTWGYQNDAGPGAGRQQSAADAISLSLVCDNAQFYKLRSLPTLEYMLSRKSASTKMTKPDFMGGFTNAGADLVASYRLTGGRNAVIKELLESRSGVTNFSGKRLKYGGHNSIAVTKTQMATNLNNYRLTGKTDYLNAACEAADRYIEARINKPVENFKDVGSSFWTEISPLMTYYMSYTRIPGRKNISMPPQPLCASTPAISTWCRSYRRETLWLIRAVFTTASLCRKRQCRHGASQPTVWQQSVPERRTVIAVYSWQVTLVIWPGWLVIQMKPSSSILPATQLSAVTPTIQVMHIVTAIPLFMKSPPTR